METPRRANKSKPIPISIPDCNGPINGEPIVRPAISWTNRGARSAMEDMPRGLLSRNLDLQVEDRQRQADYHAAFTRKCAMAAARPWLYVAPDPPPSR
jgi:hypothetical protein